MSIKSLTHIHVNSKRLKMEEQTTIPLSNPPLGNVISQKAQIIMCEKSLFTRQSGNGTHRLLVTIIIFLLRHLFYKNVLFIRRIDTSSKSI